MGALKKVEKGVSNAGKSLGVNNALSLNSLINAGTNPMGVAANGISRVTGGGGNAGQDLGLGRSLTGTSPNDITARFGAGALAAGGYGLLNGMSGGGGGFSLPDWSMPSMPGLPDWMKPNGGGGSGGGSSGNNAAGYAALLAGIASSQNGAQMPATPDFVGAANATAAGNLKNAEAATTANRTNQTGIGGSSNWAKDPTTGQWTQSQTLSQPNQAMYGQAQSGLANAAGKGLNYSAGNPELLQQNVTDAMYNQQARYLDPQFQQSQSALENQLANQGITRGSEAYNNAMNNANMQKEQAYGNARNSAIGQGVGAAQGMFGMNLSNAQLGNSAANQGVNQNLGMMQGLTGLAPQGSQYNQTATAGADLSGAAQGQAGWNQGIYNANQAKNNALTTGMFGLAGSLIK